MSTRWLRTASLTLTRPPMIGELVQRVRVHGLHVRRYSSRTGRVELVLCVRVHQSIVAADAGKEVRTRLRIVCMAVLRW